MNESGSPTADEILRLTGLALHRSQFVEHNLTMICRMFETSTDVEPRHDGMLFGNAKERTASLQYIKKALKEFGINADHYLIPEINEFVIRRDWLAHRMFIDPKESKEATGAFRKQALEELISKADRLLSVFLAISKSVAENFGGAKALSDGHIILDLCKPYEKEADIILNSMMTRTPIPPSTKA